MLLLLYSQLHFGFNPEENCPFHYLPHSPDLVPNHSVQFLKPNAPSQHWANLKERLKGSGGNKNFLNEKDTAAGRMLV